MNLPSATVLNAHVVRLLSEDDLLAGRVPGIEVRLFSGVQSGQGVLGLGHEGHTIEGALSKLENFADLDHLWGWEGDSALVQRVAQLVLADGARVEPGVYVGAVDRERLRPVLSSADQALLLGEVPDEFEVPDRALLPYLWTSALGSDEAVIVLEGDQARYSLRVACDVRRRGPSATLAVGVEVYRRGPRCPEFRSLSIVRRS